MGRFLLPLGQHIRPRSKPCMQALSTQLTEKAHALHRLILLYAPLQEGSPLPADPVAAPPPPPGNKQWRRVKRGIVQVCAASASCASHTVAGC